MRRSSEKSQRAPKQEDPWGVPVMALYADTGGRKLRANDARKILTCELALILVIYALAMLR